MESCSLHSPPPLYLIVAGLHSTIIPLPTSFHPSIHFLSISPSIHSYLHPLSLPWILFLHRPTPSFFSPFPFSFPCSSIDLHLTLLYLSFIHLSNVPVPSNFTSPSVPLSVSRGTFIPLSVNHRIPHPFPAQPIVSPSLPLSLLIHLSLPPSLKSQLLFPTYSQRQIALYGDVTFSYKLNSPAV